MNSVRLYQHYLPIWRRFKVGHIRDSFLEVLKVRCPFGRTGLLMHRTKRLSYSEVRAFQSKLLIEVEKLNLRTCHFPLQYIVGKWSFRDVQIQAVPPVFIPRFETQQLLTILSPEIERLKPVKFLDLCCGSGAIAVSLVKEFDAQGVAVDIDKRCIRASRNNLLLNRLPQSSVKFVQSDCIEYLQTTQDRFNLIITNPPYLSQKAKSTMPKEVIRYESHLALFGGQDGLDYVRNILANSSRIILPGGILAVEYGGEPLPAQFQPYVVQDFYGCRRFIIIRY